MKPTARNKLKQKIWMVPVCKAGHPQVPETIGEREGKPVCLRCVQKTHTAEAVKRRPKKSTKPIPMCPVHRIPFVKLSPEHDTRRELGYLSKCPWKSCPHGTLPRESYLDREYLADFGRRHYLNTLGKAI